MADTSAQLNAPVTITIESAGGKSVISVAASSSGGTTPPPVKAPSPDGTSITTIGPGATDNALRTFTLVAEDASKKGQQVAINGTRDTRTGVVARLYAKGGVVHQMNTFNSWYFLDTGNVWHDIPDPTGEKPPVVLPPSSGVPAPAQAAGYTKCTLGPAVTLGQGVWDKSIPESTAKQMPDGSVWMAGPWHFNDLISTRGRFAVGGGAYVEATFKFDNSYNGDGGWPAFWMNSLEGRDIDFPNQRGEETDICEFWGTANWGGALHDWYGGQGAKVTQGTAVNMPSGQNGNSLHKYGILWIPATDTTKGRLEYYYDRVRQDALTIVWNKYNPNDQPPYQPGTTAGSVMDAQHHWLMLGTSVHNPLTVTEVQIWQKDGKGNFPPS